MTTIGLLEQGAVPQPGLYRCPALALLSFLPVDACTGWHMQCALNL